MYEYNLKIEFKLINIKKIFSPVGITEKYFLEIRKIFFVCSSIYSFNYNIVRDLLKGTVVILYYKYIFNEVIETYFTLILL